MTYLPDPRKESLLQPRPVALPGGFVIRTVRPDDAPSLDRFHESLDANSQYLRFFLPHPHLTAKELIQFTQVDHLAREALVVIHGERALVGIGRYEQLPTHPDTAEVAFVVMGPWRGHGLATTLLHQLAHLARSRGITWFVAETLGANQQMRDVFRTAGYPLTSVTTEGVVETRMDIGLRHDPAGDRTSRR